MFDLLLLASALSDPSLRLRPRLVQSQETALAPALDAVQWSVCVIQLEH